MKEKPVYVKRVTAPVTIGILLLILLATSAAVAQGVSDAPGAFVDVGIGAGPMGMGGAVIATVDGPEAIFWNPARLAAADGARGAGVHYADVMGLVTYTAVSGFYRLDESNVLGVGLIYSGDDVLSETTLLLSGARTFAAPPWSTDRQILAGVTFKSLWASYGNNASTEGQVGGTAYGFGLDAGATVPVPIPWNGTFAMRLRDMLSTVNWDSSVRGSYDENVPASLIFGLGATPLEELVVEMDLEKGLHLDSRDHLSLGARMALFRIASLRAGYRKELSSDGFDELALGAGSIIRTRSFNATLDLAYVMGHLDDTLRFSFGFLF
jgi:hypothetical protein